MPYNPSFAPTDEGLRYWVEQELYQLVEALVNQTNVLSIQMDTWHEEPEKPQNGMVVLADGTDWNPGSGEGFYGYYNSTWNFLG